MRIDTAKQFKAVSYEHISFYLYGTGHSEDFPLMLVESLAGTYYLEWGHIAENTDPGKFPDVCNPFAYPLSLPVFGTRASRLARAREIVDALLPQADTLQLDRAIAQMEDR